MRVEYDLDLHRKPMGFKEGGSYNTGGDKRLDVYDWLSDIPKSEYMKPFDIVELSFNKGSRKDFFKNGMNLIFKKGDMVVVEGSVGYDVGEVSLFGDLVRLQLKKKEVKDTSKLSKILRLATEEDLKKFEESKKREKDVLLRSRVLAKNLNLEMKLCEVEIQADGKKATFYYTADNRVDFRQLIRDFATEFHMKVEMKQIGVRQEAAKIGGIELGGLELSGSAWLTNFKSVNISAARVQNLSINMTKLTDPSGRLKQDLLFELDTYLDALKNFPKDADKIKTKEGTAYLQKREIFKKVMWYAYKDNHKLYPLSVQRVTEIKELNDKGTVADELKPLNLDINPGSEDHTFVDVVGQVNLNALEKIENKGKNSRKHKKNRRQHDKKNKPSR